MTEERRPLWEQRWAAEKLLLVLIGAVVLAAYRQLRRAVRSLK